MLYNMDPLIQKILSVVESHKLAPGDYARFLWQNSKCTREMGSNPYGCADAANILYTLGYFPTDDAERAAFVHHLTKFQDPETGLFHESTHHAYHTTAHCSAALELFDKRPLYPLVALREFDDTARLCEFLDSLAWVDNPWTISHQGAGVFAAKIICETPTVAWQDAYFSHLTALCDPKYGLGKAGAVDLKVKSLAHHLNGWFHYLFNFNHCHREIPRAETLIDTLIDEYYAGNLENQHLCCSVGFRSIDWVFALNRASLQCGYRRAEAKEAMRHFAKEHFAYLETLDPATHDTMNDLHSLFGTVCCLSELQLALPGELPTTVPLKNVLDRRPFI
ncbi:MAG: hypothetical protein J6B77_08165 [Clostridia bacterium]|nr:hypothetical protein [Clostridia bacterium]